MGARPTVVLELDDDNQLARDLAAGGVFVPGCTIAVFSDCELVVRGADTELTLSARVVFVDGRGAGLELVDCAPDVKERLAEMGKAATLEQDEAGEEAEQRKIPLNVHERLRGLTLVQQIKIAHHGEISERMVLERIYGKTVWDPLLRNPRITSPEVARIARMGALPRPLVELIVGNGAWLQIPEIRRALLTNPRMGNDQIIRVLRLLPKHELKLATVQTSYSHAVREHAKRILRELA